MFESEVLTTAKLNKIKQDTILKNFWKNNDRFADLFNTFLFNGEEILKPDDITEVDTDVSSMLKFNGHAETVQKILDVVKKKETLLLRMNFYQNSGHSGSQSAQPVLWDAPERDVYKRQTVAFVGPSGGGKTTLANLISRFFDPQSGMVTIGGVNVKDIPKEELMNTVSFVFQNSRLIKASILENVRMGKPEATREEILAALHHAQCDDILEKLPQGVDTVIGTKGVYLSGGEQQRIAIARVMLKNAPIIILDEATAFADPDNESRVQAAFSRLSEGKTVIMIAHRLSTVTNVDQIFVICDGRVAECGNSRELLAKDGIFSRMWKNYQTSVQWKVTKEVQ